MRSPDSSRSTGSASGTIANDPHAVTAIERAGPPLTSASAALVLFHGRGATAGSILEIFRWLNLPKLAAIAPQAAGDSTAGASGIETRGALGGTWYPYSFLAPIKDNQPHLDSALAKVNACVQEAMAAGFPAQRIALLGFSQGACLCCEFVARNPRNYGAVIALTGGLIGPERTPRDYEGSLQDTPILLASGDPDPHVPFARVLETQAVFERMDAIVEVRRYAGMPHAIIEEELQIARRYLQRMIEIHE